MILRLKGWLSAIRVNLTFLIYLFVFTFLLVGVYVFSGFRYFDLLFLYIGVFIGCYFLWKKIFNRYFHLRTSFQIPELTDNHAKVILLISCGFIVAHFIYLGYIPVLEALNSNDDKYISYLRRKPTEEAHFIWNYLSSFIIKAILPFFILYFYRRSRIHFILAVAFGLGYSIALMPKSNFLTIFLPLLIYVIAKRHFLASLVICTLIYLSMQFISYVANPELRGMVSQNKVEVKENNEQKEGIKVDEGDGFVVRSVKGLMSRVVVVPGRIVSDWFDLIPERFPFLKGCGYHFLTPFNGCQFVDYSTRLYGALYPEYYNQGVRGSVNVASFMYDYSNFGKWGLIYSAMILSIFFCVVDFLFEKESLLLKLSINFYYILALSSSALSTLLFSGGWGLMILLFFLFKNGLRKA